MVNRAFHNSRAVRMAPCVCALAILAASCPGPMYADEATEDFEESVTRFGEAISDVFNRVWVPRSRFRDSPHVRTAFQPVVETARNATVEVFSGDKQIALGGVIGPDGWILTKASLLIDAKQTLVCHLADERELPARVVGLDSKYDLAMLKVEATGLETLDLAISGLPRTTDLKVSLDKRGNSADTPDPETDLLHAGDWVATVGAGQNPVAIGVVSVAPREIKRRNGFLGVGIDHADDGVRVIRVQTKSAASSAGIRVGDVIQAVNEASVATPDELSQAIQKMSPGEPVDITVVRTEESKHEVLVVRAILRGREYDSRSSYQNRLGGDLSNRRFGFPSALQHDTVLEPNECGGPLVDLDGRVIGFNIARAGRTESYAIPVSAVRERLFDLMSGRLAPED